MISDYAKLESNGLIVEVNWSKDVTPCKHIKFTIGNDSVVLPREEFYKLMFIFGDDEQQEQLVPVESTTVREITRLLKVKVKTDVKKGDVVTFPYTYYIPSTVKEKFIINGDDALKDSLEKGKTRVSKK